MNPRFWRGRRVLITGNTGFKGVCFRKDRGTWIAHIRLNGILKYLGSFHSPQEAGDAYRRAATLFHGEFQSYEINPTSDISA